MIFFISNRWAAHHGGKKAKLETWSIIWISKLESVCHVYS